MPEPGRKRIADLEETLRMESRAHELTAAQYRQYRQAEQQAEQQQSECPECKGTKWVPGTSAYGGSMECPECTPVERERLLQANRYATDVCNQALAERDALLARQRTDQQTIAELRGFIDTAEESIFQAMMKGGWGRSTYRHHASRVATLCNLYLGSVDTIGKLADECGALAATLAETQTELNSAWQADSKRQDECYQSGVRDTEERFSAKLRAVREMIATLPGEVTYWKTKLLALIDAAAETPTQTTEEK